MNTHAGTPTLTPEEERRLAQEEKAIARKYIGGVPWIMVFWGLGNFVFWLSLWPLTFSGVLPLWAGFCLSTISIAICYLPSHEAQHSNIAARGKPYRWLNELVGQVSTIPMVLPYRIARLTHMEHHAHCNDPELDPDYKTSAKGWIDAIVQTIRMRQPGVSDSYGATLKRLGDTPATRAAAWEAAIMTIAHYGILAGLAWSGFALEALFLWWLPRQIGVTYIVVFLSWAPHFPAKEKGRYRDTRAWRFALGNILSMGMQYHIVHHLHPSIPLHKNPAAYWDMRHILEARGCRIDGL